MNYKPIHAEPCESRYLCKAITQEVHDDILHYVGEHHAERGGILGQDATGMIRFFEADITGRCSSGAYDPDIAKMNAVIKRWKTEKKQFCGFVHSHPHGLRSLSGYDRWYAGEILDAFPKMDFLWLPLVMTIPDTGEFEIIPYVAIPGAVNRKACIVTNATFTLDGCQTTHIPAIQAEVQKSKKVFTVTELCQLKPPDITEAVSKNELKIGRYHYFGNFAELWVSSPVPPASSHKSLKISVSRDAIESALKAQSDAESLRDSYLSRFKASHDLELLSSIRLIVIGAGGDRSFLFNCVRMGFEEIISIDHDIVSASNVGTQLVYPDQIGLPKVEALARDIIRINPAAAVLAIADRIENINDKQFASLLTTPLRYTGTMLGVRPNVTQVADPDVRPRKPSDVILLVMTDDFQPQGRGHRLGLHFGLSTICAQEYQEGRGAEITYTVPGVTPACHRCITSSRYRAYHEGYRNTVTSHGAPIVAAEFLNAALGHIILAIAHHGTNHSRWGQIISRLGNRNLVRLRMDPDFDTTFGDTFSKRLKGAAGRDCWFMLDSLYLPQTPDCGQTASRPVCPDCGGTGNLNDSVGKFSDTRIMHI